MAELKQEVDAATGRLTYTIRVKNLESAASIRIIKTDQMDKALEGAVFSISGDEIDAEENLRSKIPVDGTDAEIYTNENMAPGTYTLTETEAPGAYIKLKDPVIIKIGYTDSGVSVKASMGGQDLGYPLVMQDQKTGIWTIRIINSGGFELPHTGGSGRDLFVMLGTAMALMAGLLLVIRYRIDVDRH